MFSFILDFTDGMVARFHKKSSFNGRFIDGLFDIIVFGLLHIILFETVVQKEISFFYSYFYLVTILIYPVQHFIMDRYSAIARWINEIQGKKIKQPYYRNSFFGKTHFYPFPTSFRSTNPFLTECECTCCTVDK